MVYKKTIQRTQMLCICEFMSIFLITQVENISMTDTRGVWGQICKELGGLDIFHKRLACCIMTVQLRCQPIAGEFSFIQKQQENAVSYGKCII